MTIIKSIAVVGTVLAVMVGVIGIIPTHASEVTGTLSSGSDSSTDTSTSGTIGGSVGGSSGNGGGSSGSGGGGNNNSSQGSVLGAFTDNSSILAVAPTPTFPNAGDGSSNMPFRLYGVLLSAVLIVLGSSIIFFAHRKSKKML